MPELTDEQITKFVKLIRDDRILVRPEPQKMQSVVGGLVLPDSSMEEKKAISPFRVGRVVAVGPGMACQYDPDRRYPMDVKKGDRILHHMAARDLFFLNGEGFLLMGNRDVSLVLDEEAEIVQLVIKPAGVPG